MSFNGSEGGPMILQTASQWTARYRSANPNEVKGFFIGKDRIAELLSPSNAMGIRVYYALDDNGDKHMVFCAADANEADITDKIIQYVEPCPTRCKKSPLNS